jgi:hypothetical protein
MEAESVILLGISSWFLVAAAMLWGMLRIVRRHACEQHPFPQAKPAIKRKPRRPKRPRPVFSPAQRAAQHFVHR